MMHESRIDSADTHNVVATVRGHLRKALAEPDCLDLSWVRREPQSGEWSLAPDTLQIIANLVQQLEPKHILEFGSGLSTYVFARVCDELKNSCCITSVDHDPEFGAATARRLTEKRVSQNVRIQIAPLIARQCAGRLLPLYHLRPSDFASTRAPDLVLIDGPPLVLGGREGTLYQVMDFARTGTLVILDDAKRPEEQAALSRWRAHLGSSIEVDYLANLRKGMAAITVREPVPIADLDGHHLRLTAGEIAAVIPQGDTFIIVDENQFELNQISLGRSHVPFLERNGRYWGPPADDETAIAELERLRKSGASYMIFALPAFWWLEHYIDFQRYLRSRYQCILENDCLVVFDLGI